jgi:hypothetical protein
MPRGLDAEYGNAQSGIVNIITQEGGDAFSGEVTFMTDDFGAPDKTYNNYDRLQVGMGGPTPIKNLNYYLSGEGTWTDTYLKTKETRDRQQFLDFITIGPRQNDEYNLQGKLSWKPGPNYKMTLETLDNHVQWDDYEHSFSREGFVETRIDTIEDTGEIVTRYGAFSERQEGPNWVYYNAPEHTPNYDEKTRIYKLVWNHTLSQGTFYSLKVSQASNTFLSSVRNLLPWEYEGEYPDQWRDRINFRTPVLRHQRDADLYRAQQRRGRSRPIGQPDGSTQVQDRPGIQVQRSRQLPDQLPRTGQPQRGIRALPKRLSLLQF